jgi:DNA-binding transcriptional ArsR family regulator
VHLVPADRQHLRAIDGHRVCEAIAGLGDVEALPAWAERFALLGDPTRLALLMCMRHGGPISVSDLAIAANVASTKVSQALRLLRAHGAVVAERDGHVVRYRIADAAIDALLSQIDS